MRNCTSCDLSSPGDYCSFCGRPLGQRTPVKSQITVLCSDLQDSTGLGQSHSLEQAAELIGAYHDIMESAVTKSGGHVAQIGGDDFVAYFGYPNAADNAPKSATAAALAAIRAIRSHHINHDSALAIRIALHQGPAVVFQANNGDIQFGGPTPIVAARLQVHAKPNTLVVSETVREAIATDFELEELGILPLKGFAEPVRAFTVIRPQQQTNWSRAAAEQQALIGREAEVLWLRNFIQGQGQAVPVVTLSGEPGIGKSRLLQELVQQDQSRWLIARCEPQTQLQPLDLIYRVVNNALENQPHAKDSATPDATFLARVIKLVDSENEGEIATLAALFGRTPTAESVTTQHIAHLLQKIIVKTGKWLWIDDAHSMDEQSLAAMTALAKKNDSALRGRILMTCRPEFDSSPFSNLPVLPLSQQQTSSLAANLYDTASSVAVAEFIHQQTHGNPLYIEQLTIALADAGYLQDTQVALPEGLDLAHMPRSLSDLLINRIDALDESRYLLQTAAVLGTVFDLSLVESLYARSATEFAQHLSTLCDRGLWDLSANNSAQFKHGLIRDAAYATLLQNEKKNLHQRAAHLLEVDTQFPQLLGYHWEQGEQPQLAISAYTNGAKQLLGRSLHHESLSQSEQALALLAQQPRSSWQDETEYELLVVQGNALSVLENYGSSRRLEVSERTLDLSDRIQRGGAELLPILYGRWTLHLARSNLETREWAERLARVASQDVMDNPIQIEVTTNFVLATTLFMEGEITESITHFELALHHYDSSQHVRLMQLYGEDHGLYSSVWLQWAYAHAGRIRDAMAQSAYSDELAAKFGDPMATMLAMTYKMHIFIELAEFDKVLDQTDRILVEVEKNGLGYYGLIAKSSKCRALMRLGREDEADQEFLRGNRHAPEYQLLLVTINREYASHSIESHDAKTALEEIQAARGLMKDRFERNYVLDFNYLEGRAFQLLNKPIEAERAYLDTQALAQDKGANYFRVKAGVALVKLYLEQGRIDEAVANIELWQQTCNLGDCDLYQQAADLSAQLVT